MVAIQIRCCKLWSFGSFGLWSSFQVFTDVLFRSYEFGLTLGKCTPVNSLSVGHQLLSFITNLSACENYKIMKVVDLSVGVYTVSKARRSIQGQLEMTHIIFGILNSHVTVAHLRFIKSTHFHAVKQIN